MGRCGYASAHTIDVMRWKSARELVLWADEGPNEATGFACVCQVDQNSGHLHNEFSPSLVFFCQPGEMLNDWET